MILPRAADVLARAAEVAALTSRASCSRYTYNYSTGRYTCRSTPWSRYGRWILAGVLIFLALIAVFLFVCIASRRKRRARQQFQSTPMTNTANTGYYPPPPQQQQYNAPPGNPPQYGGGNYGGGANEGYYGQSNGIAQPANTYQK